MTEFPAMVSPDSPSSSRDTARLVEEEGREAIIGQIAQMCRSRHLEGHSSSLPSSALR